MAGGIISERMPGVTTSPASGVLRACTDSPRNSSHELLSLSEQAQPVLQPDLLQPDPPPDLLEVS